MKMKKRRPRSNRPPSDNPLSDQAHLISDEYMWKMAFRMMHAIGSKQSCKKFSLLWWARFQLPVQALIEHSKVLSGSRLLIDLGKAGVK